VYLDNEQWGIWTMRYLDSVVSGQGVTWTARYLDNVEASEVTEHFRYLKSKVSWPWGISLRKCIRWKKTRLIIPFFIDLQYWFNLCSCKARFLSKAPVIFHYYPTSYVITKAKYRILKTRCNPNTCRRSANLLHHVCGDGTKNNSRSSSLRNCTFPRVWRTNKK